MAPQSPRATPADLATWNDLDAEMPWFPELRAFLHRLERAGRLPPRPPDYLQRMEPRLQAAVAAARRWLPAAADASDAHFVLCWLRELVMRVERLHALPRLRAVDDPKYRELIKAAQALEKDGSLDAAAEGRRRAEAYNILHDFPTLERWYRGRRGVRLSVGALDRWMVRVVRARFPALSRTRCCTIAGTLVDAMMTLPRRSTTKRVARVRHNTRRRSHG